ncbi:MAG: flagellar biosynthetic protein FliQ [Pseudomonadota bacterium]
MSIADFRTLLVTFMMDTVILAGIPLAVATLSGFVVSALQAVTQIQDQTLNQTIKIAVIVATLLAFGDALVMPLVRSTEQLFLSFAEISR